MVRMLNIFILVFSLGVAGLATAGPSKRIDPQPVPQDLAALEESLSGPGLVGLFYLDMKYLLRLEKVFVGEKDPLALPTATGKKAPDSDSFLSLLGPSGLRVLRSVDYVIGGYVAGEKDAGNVQVALGKFSVESINRHLKRHQAVKPTAINGRPAWLWSPVDAETCKPSTPQILVAESNRLISGDPATVAWFLKRLDKVKAAKNLAPWRKYRKGKLFGFAVFLPKNLQDIPPKGIASMLAQGVQEKMAPVTGIYGGGTVTWNPDGLNLELLLESSDSAWNRQWHQEFQKWKKKTVQGIDKDFKSVKNLLSYLDSQATGKKLVLQARFNEALIKDFGSIAEEGVQWFASSLSSSMSISGGEKTAHEQIIPLKEINQYKDTPAPGDLDLFDTQASADESFIAASGPFGIKVKGVSLNPQQAGAVDLQLEVVSSPIPKLEINPSVKMGKGTGAWFKVTHVYDHKGRELLKNEACGKDRNSQYATLQKGFRNVDAKRVRKTPAIRKLLKTNSEFSNLTLNVLQGNKTVHLRPGTLLSDIAMIEGEVIVQLPSNITRKRVRAPFRNKVIQTSGLRIKMKEGKPGSINFIASGEVGRLLEVRALNGAGKYLRNSSSMSSSLFFGQGISKNANFRGQPKTAEFVIARVASNKTYPFRFKFRRPAYPAQSYFKPVAVATLSRKAFVTMQPPKPKREVCSRDYAEFKSGAFYICLHDHMYIQNVWRKTGKYASGSFLVHTLDLPAVTNNLSAVQMVVEKVIVTHQGLPKRRTLSVHAEKYLALDSNYSYPLKGDQFRMEAGPVGKEDENLTPVGFEGYLKIRLPRKLATFRVDLFELGSTAKAANGLQVKFIGIEENTVQLEIQGPRETLVHFTPLNLSGKPLSQWEPRVEKLDSGNKNTWQAKIKVPPETRYMDIVYATRQDIWKIPFRMEK